MKDLEEAIQTTRQATSVDHPDHLGNELGHRYERTGEMKDLEEAIHHRSKHWHTHRTGPGVLRSPGQHMARCS